MDIYDIPIAEITRQYLEYVDLMKELDLELAGEFILMAATLIQIKVRMLLPRPQTDEEIIEEDPRAELVRRLLEYKKFKEVAESMEEIENRQRRLFPRSNFEWTKAYQAREEVSNEELLKDVSMFDLLSAFKIVIDNMPKITSHEIKSLGLSVDDQIDHILKKLEENERVSFFDVTRLIRYKIDVIVTFMALLELIKRRLITIQQAYLFGDIWIIKRAGNVE